MTEFFTTVYRNAIIDKIPTVKFPLTHAMCDKNDYEHLRDRDVLVMLQVRYGKLLSVAIYQEADDGSIHVFSFEVTSDCRYLDYGTNAMAELKKQYAVITLNSLPESRVFYEKQGFVSTGETTYKWIRQYD